MSTFKGPTFDPSAADINAACKGDCVLTHIQSSLDILAAAKPTDSAAKKLAQKQALSFVVHFIGDIHQPLHAADRDGDRGGNDEHVKFFGTDNGGDLELHGIWDKQIVSRIAASESTLAANLKPEIAKAAAESPLQPADWAVQSYRFARDVSYKDIPPPNGKKIVADLGQPYQDKAAPVVRIQIARAAVRLAAALQKALP